ncbi:hypothetical protein ABOM_010070 [Aspergillus bombycis]|uniref:SRR1-like domain-containing protein n=1 Tax=Aspergillus bombycis TaxID=109264 RepID=A0A1F7ZPV3_9EURO|nr:hypothetical protein ABOM_010070 [Aspergillus bombycis]OGM41473.1 hypothetical protein ABOM_010070 [Aspergillus bombycis]
MPHSNRKRNLKHPKRLEVTDPSGWTHVTAGGKSARRALRATQQHHDNPEQGEQSQILVPAEAPAQLNLEDLQAQFRGYQQRWEGSDSWRVVERALSSATGKVDRIVCVGLGSPSGFLKGGWVDRRSVSMYQLAGLVSVVDCMKKSIPNLEVFAQDPVFNTHDRSLLASLDIVVLDHPHGFEKVCPGTLLYCPGAERTHLEQLLSRAPTLAFGGPLEDIESEAVKQFVESRKSVRVPRFEDMEHAFWNMKVYSHENDEQ